MNRLTHRATSSKKMGFRFELIQTDPTRWAIRKEHVNYAPHVYGHLKKAWHTVLQNLTADEAHEAYKNRLGREGVSLEWLRYVADECRLQERQRQRADDDGMALRQPKE